MSLCQENNSHSNTGPMPLGSNVNNPSICIPRTFSNVSWALVKDAFDEIFGLGYVERVDVVDKVDRQGIAFKKIFIHFTQWPDTDYARGVKKTLVEGNTIKVIYNFPWYWKCVMSNVPRRTWNGPPPYIEIDGETTPETRLRGAIIPLLPDDHMSAKDCPSYPPDYMLATDMQEPTVSQMEEGGGGFNNNVPSYF